MKKVDDEIHVNDDNIKEAESYKSSHYHSPKYNRVYECATYILRLSYSLTSSHVPGQSSPLALSIALYDTVITFTLSNNYTTSYCH